MADNGSGNIDGVSIYWDNSNLYLEGRRVADQRDGLFTSTDFRIHFDALYRLAAAGRPVRRAICAGARLERVAKHLPAAVEVILHEPGSVTGREQGVDAVLQNAMLRDLVDRSCGVAVLLTGDGAGWAQGGGFCADLARMHRAGWGVEVLSWSHSCNPDMRAWVEEHGVFIPLEAHYDAITFLERTRSVIPLSLTGRKLAKPASAAAA